MKHTISFFLLVLSGFIGFSQSNASRIDLVKKTVIGGDGSWDYLFASVDDRRLYLSHGSQVEVINADTHEKIGVISNSAGIHGVCAIPALNKGYITNGKTNQVTVFDIKTLQPVLVIPAGKNPDALLYDKFSNKVFIFNNDDESITIIDAATDKVIQTIDTGGNPEAGVTNDEGMIYVNLEDTNEIIAISSKTLVVNSRFKLFPGEQPTGLALDKKARRLFSTCRKSELMIVLDAKTGEVLAQLPIGKGVDGVIFDDQSKLAICSNGDGTLTVVKEFSMNKFEVIDTIQTARGAKTLTFDNKTNRIFTVTAQLGETPAPTSENPKPKPYIVPGTFMVLEYGKK